MAKLKATFHVKKDIGYDELEITTSADGVTYGGGTSGLSATNVQGAIDEVVTETTASLNTKQATITGGATTIATSNLTVNKALISDANGKVGTSATSNTELGYLSGVTSAVQTQLNNKNKIQSVNYNFGVIEPSNSKLIDVTTLGISSFEKIINVVYIDNVNYSIIYPTLPFSNSMCFYTTANILTIDNFDNTNPINISVKIFYYS